MSVFYEGGKPIGRPIAFSFAAPSIKPVLNPSFKIYTMETKNWVKFLRLLRYKMPTNQTILLDDGFVVDLSSGNNNDSAKPPPITRFYRAPVHLRVT